MTTNAVTEDAAKKCIVFRGYHTYFFDSQAAQNPPECGCKGSFFLSQNNTIPQEVYPVLANLQTPLSQEPVQDEVVESIQDEDLESFDMEFEFTDDTNYFCLQQDYWDSFEIPDELDLIFEDNIAIQGFLSLNNIVSSVLENSMFEVR